MARLRTALIAALTIGAAVLALVPPAGAFDGGPHAAITQDAMRAEGFESRAASVAQVEGWFVDFYSDAGTYIDVGRVGQLPSAVRQAAQDMHFASHCPGCNTPKGITAEWQRLERATAKVVRDARARNDPVRLLAGLGASLHELQDFYAHSNWVEPRPGGGYDGPGWEALHRGSVPTWYDVPQTIRDRKRLYVAGASDSAGNRSPRSHENWNSDPKTSLNMDWQGRPHYPQAYMAAYFASRTWIKAVRGWVGNNAFWRRAQAYSQHKPELGIDLSATTAIATYAGHWYGQGEPAGRAAAGVGGSIDDLLLTTGAYLALPPTIFRRTFESVIAPLGQANPGPQPLPRVGSSAALQRQIRFIRLRVPYIEALTNIDTFDAADFYARASIGGRSFVSEFIHGKNTYAFPPPNAPFTLIRALPTTERFAQPLTELRVTIRTADVRNAGTDDNVYLRISDGRRFLLDKPIYNDFERGDLDTYSLPVDGLNGGLTLGDIRYIQIEKSRDGIAGGWKLSSVRVQANGRQIYARSGIDKWLENDHRTWRAPDFTRSNPVSPAVPVWIALYDDDGGLYGADDHADLNPAHARYDVGLAFNPFGPSITRQTTGGDQFGGPLFPDANRARIRYQLDTIHFAPPPLPAVRRKPPR